jgi:AcrR family transcriptional regulator/DNA-binding MarR family transcriptional regulator
MAVAQRPGSRRPAASGPARRGGLQVSEVQRARMLGSAVQVLAEHGYGEMSVARITARARVSRRTFYDVFEDREDCFLAVFDDAIARVSERVLGAYEATSGKWQERVRTSLATLLGFLDEQPQVRSLLVMDALQSGPRVLERRAEVLERLAGALHQGGSRAASMRGLPPLTGEGVVGAVLGVVHTRLLAKDPEPTLELLGPLVGMIVMPYLGSAAARKELKRRPASSPGRAGASRSRTHGAWPASQASERGRRDVKPIAALDPFVDLPMRVTGRTLLVIEVIGEHPGTSNREIADLAGVSDQGQISKLLQRLEGLELIENTTPRRRRDQSTGEPNAWSLTPRGVRVQQATSATSSLEPTIFKHTS